MTKIAVTFRIGIRGVYGDLETWSLPKRVWLRAPMGGLTPPQTPSWKRFSMTTLLKNRSRATSARHATTMTYFERRFAAAGLWCMHGHFIWVIPNQHFKSTLLGGREGVTKRVRCVRSWKWWQFWTTPNRASINSTVNGLNIKILRRCSIVWRVRFSWIILNLTS